jgi:hypothetical protein
MALFAASETKMDERKPGEKALIKDSQGKKPF